MSEIGLFAKEAERAVVAALFSENGAAAYEQLSLMLRPEDFYFAGYRAVYVAVEALVTGGKPIDKTLILTQIKGTAGLSKELKADVAEASADVGSTSNLKSYADAILAKSVARRVSGELSSLQKKAQFVGGDITADEFLSEVDAVALRMERGGSDNRLLETPEDALLKAVSLMESIATGEQFGVMTGLDDLDALLSGMLPGDLVIVGGRPSMGKSALAQTFMINHGIRLPEHVCYEAGTVFDRVSAPLVAAFSLEMQTDRLVLRALSNLGRVPHDAIRKGTMNDMEWNQMSQALLRYTPSDIRIDDNPVLSPATLRSKLRILMRKTGKKISLVVVDYLQLMQSDTPVPGNRTQEITDISKALKRIAKEFECPVVALAQLNRSLENRPNKRPIMADLRESGAIEQDADTIIFVYRDEVYNPDTPDKGVAELIVAKGRDVGTGVCRVEWEGGFQSFRNYQGRAQSYDQRHYKQD